MEKKNTGQLPTAKDTPHVECIKAEEISENTLGKLIKKMRKSRGLTQPELAEGVLSNVSSICK